MSISKSIEDCEGQCQTLALRRRGKNLPLFTYRSSHFSHLFAAQLRAERSERRRGLDQEGRQRSVIERTLQLTSEKHEDLKANYNKLSMQVCTRFCLLYLDSPILRLILKHLHWTVKWVLVFSSVFCPAPRLSRSTV